MTCDTRFVEGIYSVWQSHVQFYDVFFSARQSYASYFALCTRPDLSSSPAYFHNTIRLLFLLPIRYALGEELICGTVDVSKKI
jgi:hypothetical protein